MKLKITKSTIESKTYYDMQLDGHDIGFSMMSHSTMINVKAAVIDALSISGKTMEVYFNETLVEEVK